MITWSYDSFDLLCFSVHRTECVTLMSMLHNKLILADPPSTITFAYSVLDATGKTALLSWLQKGGALVAIHSGCACLFEEDFFRKQVGALFDYHPELQLAVSSRSSL